MQLSVSQIYIKIIKIKKSGRHDTRAGDQETRQGMGKIFGAGGVLFSLKYATMNP